ncbi:MAG: recombinase family protein [Clostridium sp.]|nr:recombinase family protein [Clostridium sp.]
MENCVIYARFSSHGQNEQSIEAQVRICKEYAENKGFDVVNLYTDKARTGTNDARPAFQKMIADAKTGAFQYILVYMFDRFARNRRDSIIYKEMLKEKYGVKVISALEPIAEDEGGEFYEMFLEWNAEKYSKRLSKRVRDGFDTSIANGSFCGGLVIYGYELTLEPIPGKQGKYTKRIVINEEEANVMRYVFEQYDKGVSKKQIAADLNAQGIRVKGKPITHKTFDNYMKNTKYTGEFYFGERLCTNMYPAIIDKEMFERVQQRLSSNRYFLGGKETAKEPYLLTGKLFCGHCGTEMVAGGGKSKTGKQYYYYECKKKKKKLCNKKIEHKDQLEKYVVQNVIAFLSDEYNLKVITQDVLKYFNSRTDESEIKSIRKRIADIQEEADAAANAFIEAKSPLLKQRIEKRMQECEVLLADLEKIKARLLLERGQKLTEQDIVAFVKIILQGDVEDLEFRRRLIDNLVYKVYVSDDDTYIYFNIKGGNHIEEITLEDTKAAIDNAERVLTQRDPARHKGIIRTPRLRRSSYYSL